MNMTRISIISILSFTFFFGGWSIAGEGRNKTVIFQMAEIMHRLKHYPSPQGKAELQTIINAAGTTSNERIIAGAMLSLEHQVSSKDVPLLKKVVNDNASSQHERELANIILNLDHRPTKQDKKQLKAMMN